MDQENLKFKLELYSTHWNRKPTCTIFINDVEKWSGDIDGTIEKPNVIEFEHQCNQDESYNLVIDRQGKDNKQTVVENGKIIKDQMLYIKNIEIDSIDIGALVYEGVYKPVYPEPWFTQQKQAGVELPETLKNVTMMGHNGTWTFNFTSPFYMWLLENLY